MFIKNMFVYVLVLVASSVGVLSQRCETPVYQPCSGPYNQIVYTRDPYNSPPILQCEGVYSPQTVMPALMPEKMCIQQTIVPEIAVPVAATIETTMPCIPFITELPNCPDICFNEILTSPIGCLDPILTIYGTKDVCPLPELPVSPLLPAASPISALASPFSRLSPPVSDCDYNTHFLKRVPIPPPFI